ncbi:MAG: SpoIIE family protein phosphatase [Chitinivibrionales bacterium]|nr:SpoIIE family protein phosphatase [Chitinivibrionales bacterium]MBD3357070.1 SpoIIE family protein phosphatase [Chitinivibrionales bacterium]
MAKTTTSTTNKKSSRSKKTPSPHTAGMQRSAGGAEELELSRRVQLAMVPQSLPAVTGLDIRAFYFPREAIAGDLFDIVLISEDMLAMFMLDVGGYGTSAALMSAFAKGSLQNHIRETTSPTVVLERVNGDIIRAAGASFAISAFVAYLDLHNNKLTYTTAEHPCQMVYCKHDASLRHLSTPGTKLGTTKDAYFEDESIYLSPGDRVFVFSDGVYELFEKNGDSHQIEALAAILSGEDASVGELMNKLEKRYETKAAEQVIRDDVSAMGFEILTQSRKNQIKEKLGFYRDDPVYLQFISYYEEMDGVAGVILKEMDVAGFPDETIRKMKISLTELLANAIGHGNNEDHSLKVTIGHIVNREVATVSIMDEGDGFDPQALPDPTLPENLIKDHGRGLYIVNNYVDELEHNERGNRVLIRKYHV